MSVVDARENGFRSRALGWVFARLMHADARLSGLRQRIEVRSPRLRPWPQRSAQRIAFGEFRHCDRTGEIGHQFLQQRALRGQPARRWPTIFAALAAFVLSRHRADLNHAMYFFLIMGIALPINFFTLTKIMQVAHLIDAKPGITHSLRDAAKKSVRDLPDLRLHRINPRELDDAATIDGCGPATTFLLVVMPLLTPVLVTTFILSSSTPGTTSSCPHYLNGGGSWPIILAVYDFFGQYKQSWEPRLR